ncbi:MAG: SusD/RagB family nutrient-binding outer membrane lipoprotein [Saprospiraceae bacterium]|nr:SusD/RagB family nutrient-binding outer membrane lipoprotein [Saprospiraceae bacterium]
MKNLISFLFLLALISCDQDFEAINENPNAPTADQANPALILPKILYEVGNEVTSDLSWGLGNIVVQLVATNNFTGNDIYNWGTYEGTWNLFYRNLRDAQNLQRIGEIRSNRNMQGTALILKSWIFSMLTDMYGDIPYSEALQGKEQFIAEPSYSMQKDIYRQILDDLETGATLLNDQDLLDGDIMYGGDATKWKKLAHSLRLRYIMRLEKKWEELGIDGAGLLQQLADQGQLLSSNADNAKIDYLSSGPNRWPLHTARVGSFDEKRMSETAEKALKSINDPRLAVLYRPVDNPDMPGEFIGVPNGLSEDNASNYNGGAKNQSRLGFRFREEPDGVDMMLIHAAEVHFLLAEAMEKGYVAGGTQGAESHYLKGIETVMEYYGTIVDQSYYQQPGVSYNGSEEGKLELIAKQKWLSLFMVGLEAWFDWRRTGLPQLTPGPDAILPNLPVRIQYPDNEQVLNGASLEAAISRQGPNEITTRMWLLE